MNGIVFEMERSTLTLDSQSIICSLTSYSVHVVLLPLREERAYPYAALHDVDALQLSIS